MNYPWTDPVKKLKKALEESKDDKIVRMTSVEDLMESIKNRVNQRSIFEKAWDNIRFTFHDVVWDVYRFFKPCHKRIRKVIPNSWCDLSELVILVNFEIIKSFVEEEMDSIEWNSDDKHKEVAAWLNSSYKYITKDRIELQNELSKAYDNLPKGDLLYEEKYKDVIRIENSLEEFDKSIIIGIANYRNFFWS